MCSSAKVPREELLQCRPPEGANKQRMTNLAFTCRTKECGVLPKEASLIVAESVVSRNDLVYVEVALQSVSAKVREGFVCNYIGL